MDPSTELLQDIKLLLERQLEVMKENSLLLRELLRRTETGAQERKNPFILID